MKTSDNSEDSLINEVVDVIRKQERSRREVEYLSWCDRFASTPSDFIKTLKDGLVAHVELQPGRWIQHGLDLIGSRKASGTIQLFSGEEGPDLRSFLPYPVFQMGAEVFLKGMWLYQYAECRNCTGNSYFTPDVRADFLKRIKAISRTHDLLEILNKVEAIDAYFRDAQLSRFLKIVAGVAKEFYFPVTDSDWRWADERYPKRFYNDSTKVGKADAYKSYPEQRPIARLFAEAAERLEFVWRS
ncbi:MAG: hypothetical protein HY300_09325 [Verrucomicrobia bacterium]|nr:hypothetical protein [Verrucomicrobiota bacterium]